MNRGMPGSHELALDVAAGIERLLSLLRSLTPPGGLSFTAAATLATLDRAGPRRLIHKLLISLSYVSPRGAGPGFGRPAVPEIKRLPPRLTIKELAVAPWTPAPLPRNTTSRGVIVMLRMRSIPRDA